MKLANDPDVDYRLLVMQGYDQCAPIYETIRAKEIEPAVEILIDNLESDSEVLDLGCGAGVPIAKALSEKFKVTGVDFSSEMLSRARKNVPQARFINADYMEVDLPPSHFDATICFYSLFHLPKEKHRDLLNRTYFWLKDGGYLLVTVARENEDAYTEEYLGVTMYWSNYGLEEYLGILDELGFEIIKVTSVGHGYKQSHETHDEDHPLVFARKRNIESLN